ncbi:hypothetical protein CAL26_01410 [Bordetella genomosp. 9]|uniref:Type IV secretion system protein VirB9 n=1 Tax=Bordetella genomosp. 9 TaxID=1416803 RepID=A0A261RLZ7_9BORD|nr:TrbG/VirB9 family P-type conjugative transfer protein [Bordetella genomosp. 9]OZI26039.1 hypothetical protein CAL26_01410 [Bordetella genomosp. 9]
MNRTVKLIVGAILAATLGAAWKPALALDHPHASPKDSRIRWANYDPDNVIEVDTALGVATQIELSKDEHYVTHAFGDGAAYAFQQIGNHLLLKPIVEQADTNLLYITDQRSYSFSLRYVTPQGDADKSSDNKAESRSGKKFEKRPSPQGVFRLVLRYPDDEQAKDKRREDKALVEHALARTDGAINWQSYTMNGDTSIAPVNAWDDGAQTWLRFAPGQDLPVVYFVDADGQEVIPNRHMADEHTIVVHRTAALWHLRLGNQVLAIHNDSPIPARSLPTRTISPAVERIIREEPGQ